MDEILADENEYGGVLWALRDQFYSVRDLVDHAGGHYNHIDYDAFGNVIGEMKLASQGHLVHAYGFQGRERDQESGLNYHRNRYYDALIGRWRSEDPIGFAADDVNLNRFVGNMVLIAIDPTGLQLTPQREGQLVHNSIANHVARSNPNHTPFLDNEISTIIRATLQRRIPRNRLRPDIVLVDPGRTDALGPQCAEAWVYEIKPDNPFWLPVGVAKVYGYVYLLQSNGLKTHVGNGRHRGVNGATLVQGVGPVTWRFAGGVIAYSIKRPTPQLQPVPMLLPIPGAVPAVLPVPVPNAPPAIDPLPVAPPQPEPQAPPGRPWWYPVPLLSDVHSGTNR